MKNRSVVLSVALLLGLAVGLAALVATGRTQAQTDGDSHASVSPTRRVGEYAGVRSGSAQAPPRARAVTRARAARRPATLITWPGFEPRADGTSRFFLQLSGPAQHETHSSDGKFEVVLHGVRTHLRNTRRWLRTQHFNTPVQRARVERRGRNDLAFVFHLRAGSVPSVTSSAGEGGYQYVYVDFPAGNFLPEASRAEIRVVDEDDDANAPPPNIYEDDYQDDERPPALQ